MEDTKIKIIGFADFKDLDGYLNWYSSCTYDEAKSLDIFNKDSQDKDSQDKDLKEILQNCKHEWFNLFKYKSTIYGGEEYIAFKDMIKYNLVNLKQYCEFSDKYNQYFNVLIWDSKNAYIYLGNPMRGIYVPNPELYLNYHPAVDYSSMTIADVKLLAGLSNYKKDAENSTNIQNIGSEETRSKENINLKTPGSEILNPKVENTMTTNKLNISLEGCNSQIKSLNDEIDKVRDNQTKELAELSKQIQKLQEELYIKKNTLIAELNNKIEAMEEQKYQIENQIFLLESEIYAIRCYCGEIVKLSHIRKGKSCSSSVPLVIHQKLRFLDEDLGRLASLYQIQWNEIQLFEEFIRYNPYALEEFTPNDKCIVLVRLSRNNTIIDRDNSSPYSNILKKYRYYHGKTIGILIRNGENLYLGWTDESHISMSDDLIVTPIVKSVYPDNIDNVEDITSKLNKKAQVKKLRDARRHIMRELASRSFIYNVIQGIVDNSDILTLPKGTDLSRESEYVKYCIANNWLADTRFGSFTDIIDRCNKSVKKGDMVLITQQLIPEKESYGSYRNPYMQRTWENPRGRGDKNRTHDCTVNDCEIYPINLVESEEPIEMTVYIDKNSSYPYEYEMETSDFNAELSDGSIDANNIEVIKQYKKIDKHVFVSTEKKETWYYGRTATRPARANFELYSNEYINLTYLNSVWLSWCINTKQLGDWKIKGVSVDYAHAIRYLNKAIEFIRKREESEISAINSIDKTGTVLKDKEWPLKLSEWKLSHSVREITTYQAKRFVRDVYKIG